MGIGRPDPEQLERIATDLGFAGGERYAELIDGLLGELDQLSELPAAPRELAGAPRAPGRPPTPEENWHGGWAWRCRIEGAPQGPLRGLRVAVKDNIQVAGLPMRNGTALMDGFLPPEDASAVTRVLAAGGTIVGKSTATPMCSDATGATVERRVHNPFAPDFLPGGSSAGNAITVALGEADLALGTDQGGSIRIPAAWSGCCGLKPTYGLVPYTGALCGELSLDHLGPMAASVAGCALLLEVIAGTDGEDPRRPDAGSGSYGASLEEGLRGMRVGLLREGFGIEEASEPDVDAMVTAAADSLARAGAEVNEVSVPLHRRGPGIWSAIVVQGALETMIRGDGAGTNWRGRYPEAAAAFAARARREGGGGLPPTVELIALAGTYLAESFGTALYAKAQNLVPTLRAAYDAALAEVDVLLLPTTPMKARRFTSSASDVELVAQAFGNGQNVVPFNVSGHPAISVPCSHSDGRPVGAMFVGRWDDEVTVLRVAHAWEQLRGPLGPPTGQLQIKPLTSGQ